MAKRVVKREQILIKGVDVSNWVSGYEVDARVGEVAKVTLHLQFDPNVIEIKSEAFSELFTPYDLDNKIPGAVADSTNMSGRGRERIYDK
jgi:hypothetical protein